MTHISERPYSKLYPIAHDPPPPPPHTHTHTHTHHISTLTINKRNPTRKEVNMKIANEPTFVYFWNIAINLLAGGWRHCCWRFLFFTFRLHSNMQCMTFYGVSWLAFISGLDETLEKNHWILRNHEVKCIHNYYPHPHTHPNK